MRKKLFIIVSLIMLIAVMASVVSAQYGSGGDLIDRTEDFGDWLQEDLFGTIGLFGVLIGAGLVIFGNSNGLKQIGLVLVVLCIVAAYDDIWDTLLGFFGN